MRITPPWRLLYNIKRMKVKLSCVVPSHGDVMGIWRYNSTFLRLGTRCDWAAARPRLSPGNSLGTHGMGGWLGLKAGVFSASARNQARPGSCPWLVAVQIELSLPLFVRPVLVIALVLRQSAAMYS
jgi:hypothetical protein